MYSIKHQQGARFEQKVRSFLESKGLIFVAANQQFKCGEIDLIMQDKDCIVFVEVRQRKSKKYGSAVESVTWHKQQKWLKSANLWLARQQRSLDNTYCRFDLIAFEGEQQQIQWLPNFIELNY